MRKTRKSRRGGAPTPISEPIQFSAYDDQRSNFNPNFAYETPSILREIFSSALIHNMRRDDPDYNPLQNTDELDLPVIIQRISGEVEEEIFRGEMPQWDDQKIRDFLVKLKPGDHVRLTIA